MPFNELKDEAICEGLEAKTLECKAGLVGSVMVSDAFFPFRDGVDVGIKEGSF